MTGGLYRSAHAARDGDRPPLDGATLISVDPGGSAGLEDLPGSDQPRPAVARSGDPNSGDPNSGDPGSGDPGSGDPDTGGPDTGGPDTGGPDTSGPGSGGDGSSSTASNSAIMAAGSLVSRMTGFLRTVMLGAALGGGAVGNAFTTAQMLPSQIYELLLGGILSSVLVPLLVRRRKSDPDGGQAYTQKLLTLAVAGLGVAALLAVAAAPLFTLIQAGSEGDAFQDLTTMFARLVLPIIFFTGLSALLGAVLNVRGHFAAPMWAPILNNIVVIAACAVFIALFNGADLRPETMTPTQIALIAGGTLLGMVVQAVGLVPALRKVGFRWRWRWGPRSLGLREIGGLAGWMLCYVAANQLAIFVVVNLLNSGGSDDDKAGLLIFNNVFLLIMMAHGVIGVSVMTALLPRMSAAAADGRYADIKADLAQGIRMTVTALAPIAVVYGVLAAPIAVTLFQHGNFSAAQARATTGVLVVGAFAVLPLSISYLCTYTFYALQRNKTAALINLPVVAIRIGVQLALVAVLASGLTAAGLTAGNAVSYLASAAISIVVLRKRIGRLGLRAVWMSVAKVLVAAAVAAGLGLIVVHLLPGGGTPGKLDALLQLVVGGAVIVVTYLGAAIALRVREVNQVIGTVRRKIGR